MNKRHLPLALVLSSIFAGSQTSAAAPFAESNDAGVAEAGAAVLPPKVNGVTGTLKAGTLGPFALNPADVVDVDVFAFTIDAAVTGATIIVNIPGEEANLLLLGEGFLGIEGKHDGGATSTITRNLTPGTYYIAVGLNNIGAYEATATAEGQDVWDNDSGSLMAPDSTTPIAFIGSEMVNPEDTTGQPYTVAFNFETAVTGLDQGAGLSVSKLRGLNRLNRSGKGQTVTLRGEVAGKFVILTKNTAFDRTVKSTLKGNLSDVDFKAIAIKGGKTNVTAQLKARGYTTRVKSGESVRYNFQVLQKGGTRLKANFLLDSADKAKRSISDVAGAKLNLR